MVAKRVSFETSSEGCIRETLITEELLSRDSESKQDYECQDYEILPLNVILNHDLEHHSLLKVESDYDIDTSVTKHLIDKDNGCVQNCNSHKPIIKDYKFSNLRINHKPIRLDTKFTDYKQLSHSASDKSSLSSCSTTLSASSSFSKTDEASLKLQRSPSTESHDNPFTADGELSKKADYIIRHSKISRSELLISDPDLRKTETAVTPEEIVVCESTALVESEPPLPMPNDVPHHEKNGQIENSFVNNKQIEAEVSKSCASSPPPQTAEQVKLKDGKSCKCCIVQ